MSAFKYSIIFLIISYTTTIMSFPNIDLNDNSFTICSSDEDCKSQSWICIDRVCREKKDLKESCEFDGQCTVDDKNRKCDKVDKVCVCFKNYIPINETCTPQCVDDNECEGELVCRANKCVVKGVMSPNQPTPVAVFIVVVAILGGIITITVSVVVIKSRLFKRSYRRSTQLLVHDSCNKSLE